MIKNIRFIILGILLGVLLNTAGLTSASVLNYYASTTGTAQVSGPEFYIGLTGSDETLAVNNKPTDCSSFGISSLFRTFKTQDFGGIDFHYTPKITLSVIAKAVANVATPSTLPILTVSFGYYDKEGSVHYLYTQLITLNSELKTYTFSGSISNPTNVGRFFYEFHRASTEYNYTISKCANGSYTKIILSQ